MAKPKAIQWLEDQTGEPVPFTPETPELEGRDRHLSVRIDRDLGGAVEAMAKERALTVSQLVRELLGEAVAQRRNSASLDARALVDRLAADVAEVRRRLAG